MKIRRFGCLGIFLVVLLVGSILLNVAFFNWHNGGPPLPSQPPMFSEQVLVAPGGSSQEKIAHISLRGIISTFEEGALGLSMVEDLKIALRQAVEDETVRAIVLEIDSPGGEVTASDVLYQAVVKARAAKPVVVHLGSVAASGGYYVACGGSHLLANETTITGSIGVIIQTLRYQELLGKIGVESIVFKSGKFKDLLNGAREMTPEEREYIQSLVMQSYAKFVGIVAAERKLPVDALTNGIADGRIVSGKDALEAGLINGLGQIEDAYAKARELGGAPEAGVIRYETGLGLAKLIRLLGESGQSKVEVSLGDSLLPKLQSGRMYFLPALFAP